MSQVCLLFFFLFEMMFFCLYCVIFAWCNRGNLPGISDYDWIYCFALNLDVFLFKFFVTVLNCAPSLCSPFGTFSINFFFSKQTMSFAIIYRYGHSFSQLQNICICAFDQSLFHFIFNLDTTPKASALMEGHKSEERRE